MNKPGVYQITDDIVQVKLPLPFVLKIVNCYLIRDDDGWTALDTGLNTSASRRVWQETFEGLAIGPGDIRRIVLTHSHPDHFGLAGWLQNFANGNSVHPEPPVFMSPREAELARLIWVQADDLAPEIANFWRTCGVPAGVAKTILAHTRKTRERTFPHPTVIEMLEPGTSLRIGKRNFQIIHAPGHSDGQIIFYDSGDHLLLCGDQVLMKITPNIGLWYLSASDPLGQYLCSLRELTDIEVRVALPGHGPIITHWHERLDELQTHHATRLDEMVQAVRNGPTTSYEVSLQLFGFDDLGMHEVSFAIVETLAHLEFLRVRGCLEREQSDVWRYYVGK